MGANPRLVGESRCTMVPRRGPSIDACVRMDGHRLPWGRAGERVSLVRTAINGGFGTRTDYIMESRWRQHRDRIQTNTAQQSVPVCRPIDACSCCVPFPTAKESCGDVRLGTRGWHLSCILSFLISRPNQVCQFSLFGMDISF